MHRLQTWGAGNCFQYAVSMAGPRVLYLEINGREQCFPFWFKWTIRVLSRNFVFQLELERKCGEKKKREEERKKEKKGLGQ